MVFLHKRRKAEKFNFLFKVYPKKLGTIIFTFKEQQPLRVYSDQETLIWKSASRRNEWREGRHTILKKSTNENDKVWRIDTKSVQIRETQQADGGGSCTIDNKYAEKIMARVKAKGEGGLGGGAGTTKCQITWREYYDTFTENNKDVVDTINFNTGKVIQIEGDIQHLVQIEIKLFNGKNLLFPNSIPTSRSLPIVADFDRSRKQVFLKFNKPDLL